jgi:hypothetical protein
LEGIPQETEERVFDFFRNNQHSSAYFSANNQREKVANSKIKKLQIPRFFRIRGFSRRPDYRQASWGIKIRCFASIFIAEKIAFQNKARFLLNLRFLSYIRKC